ncbi:MAG: XRE family transcriptional regulator [Spirobacillus cienkowskii]|jgi:hypothetical protein|uniref:XRE family transcriptional regulator n=1 Tax=Spirobacillus cienkowskii TaxID=495820 RepID=A0A369KTP7_9BACT|nr:MAG: XRE family transcriptional regulator [Spirobacillus cienkowskii]
MATFDGVNNTQHLRDQILNLIKQKSQRDRVDFSLNALAEAINISSSVFYRLLSQNESKKTKFISEKILKKIADYFQKDGFSITLDEITGCKKVNIEDIQLIAKKNISGISVFNPLNSSEKLFEVVTDIDIRFANNHIIAFLFSDFIAPVFPKGSLWFVNTDKFPESDTICAINCEKTIHITRYLKTDNNVIFGSLDRNDVAIMKFNHPFKILGEIIKVKLPDV